MNIGQQQTVNTSPCATRLVVVVKTWSWDFSITLQLKFSDFDKNWGGPNIFFGPPVERKSEDLSYSSTWKEIYVKSVISVKFFLKSLAYVGNQQNLMCGAELLISRTDDATQLDLKKTHGIYTIFPVMRQLQRRLDLNLQVCNWRWEEENLNFLVEGK